jgi:hypothetical protein
MSKCHNCGGYNSGDRYICPDCIRLEEERSSAFALADRQEEDQRRILEEGHVKELTRKLLDLALESLHNADLAAEKVRILMRSSTFCENERSLWNEIAANQFLSDCYYPFRLGNPPEADALRKLPRHARDSMDAYIRRSAHTPFIAKLKSAWDRYQAEVNAENQRLAAAEAKQRAIDAEENKKQEEIRKARDEQNRRLQAARDFKINLIALVYTAIHLLFALVLVQHLKTTQGLDSTPATGFWAALVCLLFLWIRPVYASVKRRQQQNYPWFGLSDLMEDGLGLLYEIAVSAAVLFCTFKVLPTGAPRVAALVSLGIYTCFVPFRRAVSHGIGGSLAGAGAFFGAKFGTALLLAGYAKSIALIFGADASSKPVASGTRLAAEERPVRTESNHRVVVEPRGAAPRRESESPDESDVRNQVKFAGGGSNRRRDAGDVSEDSRASAKFDPRKDTRMPTPEPRSTQRQARAEAGETAEAELIRDYYKAFDEHDTGILLGCLADSVDYFDQGRISKNKVLKDIEGDWRRYQATSNRVSEFTHNADGTLSFLLEYQLMQGEVPRSGVLKMFVRFSEDPAAKITSMKHQVIRAR